jgi:hypothetical protein
VFSLFGRLESGQLQNPLTLNGAGPKIPFHLHPSKSSTLHHHTHCSLPTLAINPFPTSRIRTMASSTLFSARVLVLIASILALSAQAFAQSTSSTASQPASTTVASIFPGTSPWSYYGCWNETTLTTGTNGARALAGGVQEDLTTMTAELCMSFCKSNSYTFAGIEYTKYVYSEFCVL